MYNIHCELFTGNYILYSEIYYKIYTVQCTMYNILWLTPYNIFRTIYVLQRISYNICRTMYVSQCISYNICRTIHVVNCMSYNIRRTMYVVQCTLNVYDVHVHANF